ncbi:MAG: M23 family metallopeptidase [Treponema sp.]|nr:M23 family metallopeptidase [Treponema sp.]
MKNKILRITTAVALISVFAVFSIESMSWPSVNASLLRNFGSNDRGMPVLGMIFSGGTEVLAAESGEVIFSRSKNDPASRLPSPFGSWTALDHGDGLISVYSRYAEHEIPFTQTRVEKQTPIALSGISGWSLQNGFYFMLFDRRERRWINPAMIITPIQETRPPQIISVDLRNQQGVVMQSRNLTQGRYTVVVNAAGAGMQQYAPQRIVCLINGAEVSSLNFEAVSARDGTLMVSRNGLVSARQIYSGYPSFEAAEVFLTRGQVTLEIIVQDISGANRSVVNRLIVN